MSNIAGVMIRPFVGNIFRSVNLALVNELKIVYGAMGIDISEVINAAKTKLFGLMAFYPATAWGHCIQLIRFISHGRRGNTEKTRVSSNRQVRSIGPCPNMWCIGLSAAIKPKPAEETGLGIGGRTGRNAQ